MKLAGWIAFWELPNHSKHSSSPLNTCTLLRYTQGEPTELIDTLLTSWEWRIKLFHSKNKDCEKHSAEGSKSRFVLSNCQCPHSEHNSLVLGYSLYCLENFKISEDNILNIEPTPLQCFLLIWIPQQHLHLALTSEIHCFRCVKQHPLGGLEPLL